MACGNKQQLYSMWQQIATARMYGMWQQIATVWHVATSSKLYVTEYLDPHDIWTPGPNISEIFGPPLK